MTRITPARLADGRELLYFDADTAPARTPSPDLRDLPPRPSTARMRFDALTGDWVSIATARQTRAHLPPAQFDPLAPQSQDNPSEIPDDYEVAVFENRSPSFGPLLDTTQLPNAALEAEADARGRCEVVCFSSERTGSYATQSLARARTIIDALAHRTAALAAMPGIAHVFPFENRGVDIGVTLHHPHGQIYGYPFVPPAIARIQDAIGRHGAHLFADILDRERSGPRVVAEGEHFTAFVPFAARWPVEVHLMPHRHIPDLAYTSSAERDELASLTLRITRALDALYDAELPYIGAWMQAPAHESRDSLRLHWRITSPKRAADKLKYLAGSEAAMSAWVADVAPEAGAAALRDALARADEQYPVELPHA